MDEIRAQEISHFVDLALNWQEQKRVAGYDFLILCLCSQVAELLQERVEIQRAAD